jgi:hypothetical protein
LVDVLHAVEVFEPMLAEILKRDVGEDVVGENGVGCAGQEYLATVETTGKPDGSFWLNHADLLTRAPANPRLHRTQEVAGSSPVSSIYPSGIPASRMLRGRVISRVLSKAAKAASFGPQQSCGVV